MAHSPSATRPIFAGEFRHALDGKKRITVPSRWRTSDADEFFLIRNPTRECLTVMPPDVFQSLGEDSKVLGDPGRRQDFIRRLYARAQHTSADKQGRLLLSEDHCLAAALKDEVVLTGAYDRFEIWSPANWEKFRDGEAENYQEVARQIGL